MDSSKIALLGFMATMAFSLVTTATASASGIAALTRGGERTAVDESNPAVIFVAERKCPPFCPPFKWQHDRFHERYHPKQPHFDHAHERFHKHHRKPHTGAMIYFGWYGGSYDPFFYGPYAYDPYYNWPVYSRRISCDYAGKLLRQHGYRNVKPYDCKGTTYGFHVTKGKKHYKITVSARNGSIISRKQY